MKRNHLSSIQSQNVLVRNGKMGIKAMRVRMEFRDRTYKGKKSNVNQREYGRERERERERGRRERDAIYYSNQYINK